MGIRCLCVAWLGGVLVRLGRHSTLHITIHIHGGGHIIYGFG